MLFIVYILADSFFLILPTLDFFLMRLVYPYRWIALVLSLLGAKSAAAFKPLGHEAIERRAYAILVERYAIAKATGVLPLPPAPEDIIRIVYMSGYGNDTLNSLPPAPRSQYPDISGERQFAQDLQAYHFMTSNRNVLDAVNTAKANSAEKTRSEESMHLLLVSALPECLQLMRFLMWEARDNPEGSSQSGRGIFVLMHVIADSYSAEHTTRANMTGDLLTVKGWKVSRAYWPTGAKKKVTNIDSTTTRLLLHGGLHTPGDDAWMGRAWPGSLPALVTRGMLSAQAESAAQATADLLTLFYEAVIDQQLPIAARAATQQAQADGWKKFINKRFHPLGSTDQTDLAFTFPGSDESIVYNNALYHTTSKTLISDDASTASADRRPVKDAFDYDYHTRISFLPFLQRASNRNPFALGIEFAIYRYPGHADQKSALFSRFEHGATLVGKMVSYQRETEVLPASHAAQFNALYTPNLTAFPVINAVVQGRVGTGVVLTSDAPLFGLVWGVDFAWNTGREDARRPGRFVLGYEHNGGNLPMPDVFSLKFGLNTWGTRRTKAAKE